MDDGNLDLFDDSSIPGGPAADPVDQAPAADGAGDPVPADPGDGPAAEDPANDGPGTDGTDGENTETGGDTPEETENGETSGTEGTQTPEDGSETPEGEETAEGEETETVPVVDPEILLDIKDTLHNHTDSVDSFTSGLTVSGNVIQVSLDSGSTALLTESVGQQDKIINGIDAMSGLILLVLFVLLFDLLHRTAKRIIKNFMGGEKNGTNS